jgi:hypothetical protein
MGIAAGIAGIGSAIGGGLGAIGGIAGSALGAVGGLSGAGGLISTGLGIANQLGGTSSATGANNSATQAQVSAAQQAAALNQPWHDSGLSALNQLNQYLAPGADISGLLQQQPGYQSGLNTGLEGINRAGAAAGTLNSGGTLKAATRYGQDYANQGYQNVLNNLFRMSGEGLGSNALIGSNLLNAGQAQAQGIVNNSGLLTQQNGQISSGIQNLLGGLGGGGAAAGSVQTTPFVNQGGPIIPANTPNPLALNSTLPSFNFGGI